MARTDTHRESALIAADYTPVFDFSLPTSQDGWPVPAFGINCELDFRSVTKGPDGKEVVVNGKHSADGSCCVIGLRQSGAKFASHGAPGKCTACGASFIYGTVYVHDASGEHIFLGHQCASKCGFAASINKTFALQRRTAMDHAVREAVRAAKEAKFTAFVAEHNLAADLAVDHRIIADIANKLRTWGSISPAQIALVRKLAAEARAPKPEAERKVPAPVTGKRQTVRGEVVSVKTQDSMYGFTTKMTVKVTTADGGVWLAWGTRPDLPYAPGEDHPISRGAVIEFDAVFTASDRDPSFCFFKRPTKTTLVQAATRAAA